MNPAWTAHPKSVTGPAQVVYIDSQNRIVTIVLKPDETDALIPGTVLASRPILVEQQGEPVHYTRYWNWRTGKFWPVNARKPPNPAIPNYFRLDLVGDINNPKLKYTIHSDRIV